MQVQQVCDWVSTTSTASAVSLVLCLPSPFLLAVALGAQPVEAALLEVEPVEAVESALHVVEPVEAAEPNVVMIEPQVASVVVEETKPASGLSSSWA